MAPAAHPSKIGRYQIQHELGRGMMGVVYRALDPELEREVALKTVRLAFAVSQQESEAFEMRFVAEARAVAALSHPGIVVVHDVGRDAETGTLYIALEYLPGRTLAHLIADGSRLDWKEAARLTAGVAEALHHAHTKGIVHRDVKPANIMVLPSGRPTVMDFGIAKLSTEHLTSTGQFFGTPAYMSPEQVSGEVLDGRSDLFSLGATLYLLLTGRSAFDADNVPAILARVLYQDPPPPSRLVPGLPASLDGILARTLAKKRADRYGDGRTFAADLEDVLAGREPQQALSAPASPSGAVAVVAPATRSASWAQEQEAGTRASHGRLSDRIGRRGLLALGGLAAVGVGVSLFVSSGGRAPLIPSAAMVPAQLEIDFRHSLKSGTFRVWIDDKLAIEEPLESWVKEDLLVVKVRSGREKKSLEVTPGEREVRIQVTGAGFNGSRLIRGQFESGATRRLEARLGGLLKKELTITWGS